MEQEAVSNGAFFNLLPPFNDGHVTSEVDVGGGEVAAPLYDLLGQNPEYFVAVKAGRSELLLLVALLSVLVPLVFAGLVRLVDLFGTGIGDKEINVEAARPAGIEGHLFQSGNLLSFVEPLLARHT